MTTGREQVPPTCASYEYHGHPDCAKDERGTQVRLQEDQAGGKQHDPQTDHDGTQGSGGIASVGQVFREGNDGRQLHELGRLNDDGTDFKPAAGAEVEVAH